MRKALRTAIGFLNYYLGLTSVFLFLTELLRREKTLVAFKYHRITDRSKGDLGYLIYDVGDDYRSFEVHVAAIKGHFRIVGLPEYMDFISGRRKPNRRSALLTFDDADSEFVEHALPVLIKYGCRSVVFAPTAFISTDRRFWHLRVTSLVSSVGPEEWSSLQKQSGQFPIEVGQAIRQSFVSTESRRANSCRVLVQVLDRLKADKTEAIVARMEQITHTSYSLGVHCMTWEELETIARQGASIESHTVTHRKLAFLDEQTVRSELVESKHLLEEKLRNTVTAVCYPAGSFNDKVVAAAMQAGYQAAFTTKAGLGSFGLPREERFRLRRASMHGDSKYEADLHIAKMMLKSILFGNNWDRD